jgi:2-polyprenyl-3-methyl-5-hydroxy-6-metoxy-1,4-benzoquinol methylase
MPDLNLQYYQTNAQAFYQSTIDVDMQSLYNHFIPFIKTGGSILDVGCGAGRDSLAFIEKGFDIEAFDASDELAKLATKLIGKEVSIATFQTYQTTKRFDGIWACASLLHVPFVELPDVMQRLTDMLKKEGVFYCSFKYGNEEIERKGRRFTNLNENSLTELIKALPLQIEKQWITGDLREGRESEKWLNVIMRKSTCL